MGIILASNAAISKEYSDTIDDAQQIIDDTDIISKKIISIKNNNRNTKDRNSDDDENNKKDNAFPLATPLNLSLNGKNLSEINIRVIDKINGIPKNITFFKNRLAKSGSLIFKVSGCLKNTENNSNEGYKAFIDIWETNKSTTNASLSAKPTNENIEQIADIKFSGWIFSDLPSISHIEHRVYDIRLLSCL